METTSFNWNFNPELKEAKKLDEMMTAEAKRLKKAISAATTNEQKEAAVRSYYRKYYTLTLNKTCREAGINKSPTRDIILDYPWKDLNLNRIFCLKIWEKINH